MNTTTLTKRFCAILVAFMMAFAFTMIPTDANAAKKVKKSQWKKMTVGGFTKKQVSYILDNLVAYNGTNNKKTITRKNWDKHIKRTGARFVCIGFKYYPGGGEDEWAEKRSIKTANRVLEFCSSFRLKKNVSNYYTTDGEEFLNYRTDNRWVYYYGGIGWGNEAKITSAKYTKNKMTIVFKDYEYGEYQGKYTATLKKVKKGKNKGRYKLVKIVRMKK